MSRNIYFESSKAIRSSLMTSGMEAGSIYNADGQLYQQLASVPGLAQLRFKNTWSILFNIRKWINHFKPKSASTLYNWTGQNSILSIWYFRRTYRWNLSNRLPKMDQYKLCNWPQFNYTGKTKAWVSLFY